MRGWLRLTPVSRRHTWGASGPPLKVVRSSRFVQPFRLFGKRQGDEEVRGLLGAAEFGDAVEGGDGQLDRGEGRAGDEDAAFREPQFPRGDPHAEGRRAFPKRGNCRLAVAPTGIQISHQNRSVVGSGNASSSSVHSARTLAARMAWMASSSLRLSRGRPRRFWR